MLGDSKMSSLEADFARCFTVDNDDDGGVDSLVIEWDRESNLKV